MRFARYPPAAPQKVVGWVLVLLAAGLPLCGAACGRHRAPSAAPTGTVMGRVLGARGTPLAGASVVLRGDPDDGRVPFATVKTTATGTFRIERVPTGGYHLLTRAPGHVEGLTRIEVPMQNGGQAIDLSLVATVTLAGRIQDERGTAIALARVLVFPVADATSSVIHETAADVQGHFKFDAVAPGAHRLLIEAPGLGTASAGPIQAPDQTVVVVLPGEIRAIVGRVSRAGQPAVGARLLLGGEAVPETRRLDADPQGRFAFGGLGPGTYALRAEAGGLVSEVTKQVVPERAPAQPRAVELALFPGSFVQGKVLGDDGLPLPGALVQIDLVPATGLWPPVTTGNDGQWTSPPLGPGTYRVRARRAGFVARRTATVSVMRVDPGGSAPLPPVTFEMMRTGEISGLVLDENGAALPGATVHDRLAETEELGVIWGRLPLAAEAAALPPGSPLPSALTKAPTRRATTDASGRFVLGDVPPGRVQVEILNAASVPLRTQSVTLAPGARMDVGTLRVQRAVQLTGRVLDIDDRPVSGARVSASATGASADTGAGLYAVTDSNGSFTLPLSTGEHRLTASLSGRADATTVVRLTGVARASVASVILRLAAGGVPLPVGAAGALAISGGVHDTAGRPLSRARLSVRAGADDAGTAAGSGAGSPLATTMTDAGGAFRITGLPGAHLTLNVSHDGYAPYRQGLDLSDPHAIEKSLRVVVPVPGGVDGEVHERITGAPVPRFQIEAHGPDGARARYPDTTVSRIPDRGPLRFSLRRLAPGRWTLQVRASGYRPVERMVDVAAAVSPGEPSVRDLRLELERD